MMVSQLMSGKNQHIIAINLLVESKNDLVCMKAISYLLSLKKNYPLWNQFAVKKIRLMCAPKFGGPFPRFSKKIEALGHLQFKRFLFLRISGTCSSKDV